MDAHGSFRHAKPAGDPAVGVPGGNQAEQLPLPRGQLRRALAAPSSIKVCLMQVGAQQRK
jgi:hypothetical protein